MTTFTPDLSTFMEDPYPFYALGRQLPGPLQLGPPGYWSVFTYDDCLTIMRNHLSFSSDRIGPQREDLAPPRTMLSSDPPEHTRLRGLVSQVFTPRMVEQLAPRMAEITGGLLDAVAGEGEIDAIEALAMPLPVIMIAEILGIPSADREQFKRWSNAVVRSLGSSPEVQAMPAVPEEVVEEMAAYFTKLADARRAAPRDDLLSGLVAAEHEGSRLSFSELLGMLVLLLVAGNETTTNLIGNTLIELMAHPGELARLRADPELLPSTIEEVLRYSSPVQATARRPVADTDIRGTIVPADSVLVSWVGAANRDPAAFPDPDRFDITRAPNRHLAFGHGIHFCLGAPLARLEARIAVGAFLARYREFERATDGPLPRVDTFVLRGVRSLPVRVRP